MAFSYCSGTTCSSFAHLLSFTCSSYSYLHSTLVSALHLRCYSAMLFQAAISISGLCADFLVNVKV